MITHVPIKYIIIIYNYNNNNNNNNINLTEMFMTTEGMKDRRITL
jgi:hypothetical protein